MKKKLMMVLAVFAAVVIPIVADAETLKAEGWWWGSSGGHIDGIELSYAILKNGRYVQPSNPDDDTFDAYVVGCPATATAVVIPQKVHYRWTKWDGTQEKGETIKTYVVRGIADYAFDGCSRLQSVTLPSTITRIGEGAFYGCSGLISITIPSSVTNIGDGAFYGCSGLTSVTLLSSATSIGDGTFYGCSGLRNVTIPNGVTSIGYGAFSNCTGLRSVTIPSSVTSIGDLAFQNCTSLNSIIIPSGVANIGDQAFYSCSSLTSVTIPSSVMSIGDSAFKSCTNLTSIIIPNGVANIGNYAFSSCSSLTSVTIPASVTNIGECTFWQCDGLTSVTIGNGVTSIGECAFKECYSLTNVTIGNGVNSIDSGAFDICTTLTCITIPNSVTNISEYAFNYCIRLTSVIFEGDAPMIGSSAFREISRDCVAYVRRGSTGWDVEIPGTWNGIRIEYIAEGEGPSPIWTIENGILKAVDLNGCTDVTIPNNVTSIGDGAFMFCLSLKSVTMPNSVTNIGDSAFAMCENLTSVTIPESVTSIGKSAFFSCCELTGVTIPGSVTNIENYAFNACRSLTSITIPDSVTSIADGVFGDCIGLTSVTIPNSVTSIEHAAFENCSALANVAIPSSVANIGGSAFSCCANLTSVTIPGAVTNIGGSAFSYCANLTNVTMQGDCPKVGEDAFYEVDSSCVVHLPKGNNTYEVAEGKWQGMTVEYYDAASEPIWTIVDGVLTAVDLNGCTDVTIPDGVTSIGDLAFNGCSGLTSVMIPDTVTSIGDRAFFGCSGLTSMTIPDSVRYIGESVFFGCKGLMSILVDSGNANYMSVNGLLLSKDGKTLIQGINGDVAIPDSVANIGYMAFDGYSRLTSVKIPNSVTNIEGAAFYDCSGLTSVTIPDSVASIGDSAFYNCSGLTNVTISKSVTDIGKMVFGRCVSLKNVTIPDSVTSIGEGAFWVCRGLTSVTIPRSVTNVEASAFRYCSGLTNLTMRGDCPAVGEDAFSGVAESCVVHLPRANDTYTVTDGKWEGMTVEYYDAASEPIWTIVDGVLTAVDLNGCTDVTIPDGVTSIEDMAFFTKRGLASVTMPNSVTNIGNEAFQDSENLMSVTLGNGVTSIGRAAFNGCTSLSSVTIPDSVTSIGYGAFVGCSSLSSVAIGSGVTSLGDMVFYNCPMLTSVTMQGDCPTIGADAFEEVAPSCVVHLPRGNNTYTVTDGKWQGMTVEYYDVAATTYTVTYLPGTKGTGTQQTAEKTKDVALTLNGAIFSRTGYTQTGWAMSDGGAKVYDLSASYTANAAVTLYPVWTVNSYTVTFDANGGVGGWSREMEYGTEINAPTVTREGYTFAGWQPALLGTVPASNVTFTAQWEPITPEPEPDPDPMPEPTPGPTVGPTVDPAPAPMVAETPRLWTEVTGAAPAVAALYEGCFCDGAGNVKGTIQVKVGKPGKKDGRAAVSAVVVGIDGKKTKLKASDKGKSQIVADGPTTVSLEGGESCTVVLGADGMGGTYGAYEIDGARNVFASKDSADKSAAAAVLDKWKGAVNVAWRRVEDNAPYQTLCVTIAAKGKAKVAGTLADGTKVSAGGQLSVGEEWCCVPVVVSKKGVSLQFAVWLPAATSAAAPVVVGLGDDVKVGRPGTLKGGAAFRIDADAFAARWGQRALPYLPDGVAVGGGAKWTLPKAGSVAYAKGTTTVDEAKAGENPSGLKLTYKAKDGTFKGSFKAYADVGGKPKATKVDVTGVLVDGVGYGAAMVKKVGGVAVTVE